MMLNHYRRWCFVAATAIGTISSLQAQPSNPGDGDVVVLPQLTVSAKRIIPPPDPWRYAMMNKIEVLSNARDSNTQYLVRDFGQYLNVLHSVVPATRIKNAVPVKIIICGKLGYFRQFVPPGQSLSQVVVSYRDGEQAFIVINKNDDTINVVDDLATGENGLSTGASAGFGSTNSLEESALGGMDQMGFDNDEATIREPMATPGIKLDLGEQLNRAYMRLVFSQMKPLPPVWFEEGLIQLFMRMRFVGNEVTFGEIQGIEVPGNAVEARELQTFNVELARSRLLPFDKFFEVTRDSDTYKNSGTGMNKWALQCQAFVHYCLYRRGSKLQEGFAKFLAVSSEGGVNEAAFKQCFKMSYRDMEMEIRNYIEYTDFKYQRYTFKEDTRPTVLEIREAKDSEVGRMKGEALRLAGKPELGRAELLGPYTRKRTDPELLAALGLDEVEQGTLAKAKTLLETAVKGKVVRPRAYVVLGRIYLAEWTEGENDGNKLAPEQLETIQKLVLAARVQYPPMPAVYLLYADALGATGRVATLDQIKILVEGCHAFSANLDLVYKTATLIVDSGDRKGALPLVEFGLKRASSPRDKQRFEELAARASS